MRIPRDCTCTRLIAGAPRLPVYSNVTAASYPAEREAIAAQLGDHLARPVRFAAMVEAMYADGARIFVEAGPGSTWTGVWVMESK